MPDGGSMSRRPAQTAMWKSRIPFHPWRGRRFPRQYCLTTGNVQLVRCIVDEETLRCLPRAWTDLRVVDDFERASAGRALFRADDLVALRSLVDTLLDDQH